MSLTINIYYTGKNGNAKKFAEEMVKTGVVDRVRAENYFFTITIKHNRTYKISICYFRRYKIYYTYREI